MAEQAEVERNKLHKSGQKHDTKMFETNYREQVDKWREKRNQGEQGPADPMAQT